MFHVAGVSEGEKQNTMDRERKPHVAIYRLHIQAFGAILEYLTL